MNELGNFTLALAWLLSLYGVAAGCLSGSKHNTKLGSSVANSTAAVALLMIGALAALGSSFINNDYSNQYVWQFSNRDMAWYYKISAIWGGMDGSMMLWAALLSMSGLFLALRHERLGTRLSPWTLAVFNTTTLFFLTVVLFFTNPFRYVAAPFIPPDGNGLNPLLQNPLMAIHPPTLYLGFTTHAVPYALGMGALLAGDTSQTWVRVARVWALVAWSFLTAGIVLGGHWAYVELGWGGFWAWDPVENSSFLPWLTSTAFLHSLMVQERRGMLKVWNVWLMVGSYGLTVFGTFLTRSGIVESVHAFASTDIGEIFLIYLALIIIGAAALTVWRWSSLKPDKQMHALFSREAFILFNNLLLVGICFAILWGVMFPVLSEALTGERQAVGIPFFNTMTMPLFLTMMFLMGIGPMIAWGRESWKRASRLLGLPAAVGFLAGILVMLGGVRHFEAVLSYSLSVFIISGVIAEFHRAAKLQRATLSTSTSGHLSSVAAVVRRHPSRFGGHIVHAGVALCAFGITASMVHKVEKEFALTKAESVSVKGYNLTLRDVEVVNTPNYEAIRALVDVTREGDKNISTTLAPELRRYTRNQETTTEVALKTQISEDLYLVISGVEEGAQQVGFKLFINPFQVWLWIGTIVMLIGSTTILLPQFKAILSEQFEEAVREPVR